MTSFAVVTGASSGIGQACSLALIREGWTVALVGRRADALAQTVAAAQGLPGRAVPMPTDVGDEAQVQALFARVQAEFGRLDLLFNNAGMFLPYALPGDVSGADWRRIVDVNLHGAFYCLSQAFKLMQTQTPQGGRIINNGSISAYVPRPGAIGYTATKHAITGLTRQANLDGRGLNIAVGQIHIGNVASDMTQAIGQGARQADGSIKAEARMDMQAVVDTFMGMVRLPLNANILFTTVMATQMPYVGRG